MVQSPDAVPYIGGGIYRESANRHLPRRANQVRRPTSVFHLSSPFRKNISVLQKPNRAYIRLVPSHQRGRLAIVTKRGTGCGGRG